LSRAALPSKIPKVAIAERKGPNAAAMINNVRWISDVFLNLRYKKIQVQTKVRRRNTPKLFQLPSGVKIGIDFPLVDLSIISPSIKVN
jgi:hypothetical protein